MSNVRITVRGDLSLLPRFRDLVRRGLAGPGVAPFDAMFAQWSDFYATWSRWRFSRLSKGGGGGEWPPLALSTVLGRRPFAKGKSTKPISTARKNLRALARMVASGQKWDAGADAEFQAASGKRSAASILWDTGQLFTALNIGAAGNITQRRGPAMAFGITGSDMHEPPKVDAAGKLRSARRKTTARQAMHSAVTIGQLAAYHQAGGGHLPQRKILVSPPAGDAVYNRFNRAASSALDKALQMARAAQ